MEADFLRDYAMAALIFGFFAMGWFGWAQDKPPKRWIIPLAIGSVLSGLVATTGGVLAFLNWDSASALSAEGAMQQYGIVVGIEFIIAGIGAVVLAVRKKQQYIPAWISFIVGVHFFALAGLFSDPWFHVLAAIGAIFALISIPIAKARNLEISAVCGALTGALLLVFAVRGLLLFLVAT